MKKFLLLLATVLTGLNGMAQVEKWVPVDTDSQLRAGDEYILVGTNAKTEGAYQYYAMASELNTNQQAYPIQISLDSDGNAVLPADRLNVMYITLEGESGAWYLKNQDGKYLRNATTDDSQLVLVDTQAEAVPATIQGNNHVNPVKLDQSKLMDGETQLPNYNRFCLHMSVSSAGSVYFSFTSQASSSAKINTQLFRKVVSYEYTFIAAGTDAIVEGMNYIISSTVFTDASTTPSTNVMLNTLKTSTTDGTYHVFNPQTVNYNSDGSITLNTASNPDVAIVKFVNPSDNNYNWNMKVGDKYLNFDSTNGFTLDDTATTTWRVVRNGKTGTNWQIKCDPNGGTSYSNYIQYTASTYKYFNARAQAGSVYLYKETGDAIPDVTNSTITFDNGDALFDYGELIIVKGDNHTASTVYEVAISAETGYDIWTNAPVKSTSTAGSNAPRRAESQSATLVNVGSNPTLLLSEATTPSITLALGPTGGTTYGTPAIMNVVFSVATGASGAEAENAPAEFYNLNGMKVSNANLAPGIYVVRQGSKAFKVVVK